ncbi:hypothetical protein ATJ88_3447 [Isoptericola jiangsuensis]|uniref:Lipoprotein n=1 Tax=Isoptericola jiangsuensis TaxID=548579 RepID=A0A2A9F1R3_9MICO|nr:hypothetical protein [Isoptericola jiangsuensis]PFG44711.1 hypothetical protein ATJ88_3447 [Isoptericola jiangsuensis]
MTSHRALTAVLLTVGVAALGGCGTAEVSSACVDWADYDTPADAALDADAVAHGRVTGQTGTTYLFGETAHVWEVAVDAWLQGSGARTIEVVSAPRTCENGSPYPDGDPLDGTDDVILLLTADGARWQTLTGFQGVIPAPPAGELPSEWPSPSTG